MVPILPSISFFRCFISCIPFLSSIHTTTELFPRVDSGDRDKNYFLYHPMSVEESREKAKELIVAELIKSAQATQEYYSILDELDEQSEESVREHGVSLTDDAYTEKLEGWIEVLKQEEAQISKSEQNFLRAWLNRQNAGISDVREALDDCYVEASKNPNALQFNFLAPPSRSDIAKIAAQFAEEA